jgi:DNA-binding NarL/FixJ family response regulator
MAQEQPIRVAIMGDQQLVLQLLTRALEQAGISVVASTRDGATFMFQLGRLQPEVAIFDINGGVEGPDPVRLSVVQDIHRYFDELRILVLCASGEPHWTEQWYANGADAVLWKGSVTDRLFLDAVFAVARGERFRSPELLATTARLPDGEPREPSTGPLEALTIRERQVLEYVSGGADNLKIAVCLGISERTAKAHISSLYRKLGIETRAQMALLARRLGLRPPANA